MSADALDDARQALEQAQIYLEQLAALVATIADRVDTAVKSRNREYGFAALYRIGVIASAARFIAENGENQVSCALEALA